MPQILARTDAEYLAWAGNYVHRITADPCRYGMSDDDVTTLGTLLAEFAEKLFIAKQPRTRSPIATAGKNDARRQLERAMRILSPAPRLTLHRTQSKSAMRMAA